VCLHSTAYLAPASGSDLEYVTRPAGVGAKIQIAAGAPAGDCRTGARYRHLAPGFGVAAAFVTPGSAAPVAADPGVDHAAAADDETAA